MLQTRIVEKRGFLAGLKCRDCAEKVKAGQVVAYTRWDGIAQKYLVIHVECICDLVVRADCVPNNATERFQELREEILEKGEYLGVRIRE